MLIVHCQIIGNAKFSEIVIFDQNYPGTIVNIYNECYI